MYPKLSEWSEITLFIVNVEGAVYKNDKWLIIERSVKEEQAGGTISLVGGKVDQVGSVIGTLEETVKREVFEEVGVQISNNVHYVYNSSFVSETGHAVVNVVFLCEYKGGDAYAKSPDEVENVFWLTIDEIMNHPKLPPWTKESIVRAERVLRVLDQVGLTSE